MIVTFSKDIDLDELEAPAEGISFSNPTLTIDFTAKVSPGRRARLWARPEDCYPEEPADVELFDYSFADEGLPPEIIEAIKSWAVTYSFTDAFAQQALDTYSEYKQDLDAMRGDYLRERQRER